MDTYSANRAIPQAIRRQSMRQITAHAYRQTKRIGDGDDLLTWEAGAVIGKTLAHIAIHRSCTEDPDFNLCSMLEHLLDIPFIAATPEQRTRQVMLAAICQEIETLLGSGYKYGAFRFNLDDERAVMNSAVGKATDLTARWRRRRESLMAKAA